MQTNGTTVDVNTLIRFTDQGGLQTFFDVMVALHKERDKTYKNSWCRRGMVFSIYPNTARKWDRLYNMIKEDPIPPDDPTIFDNWIDLGVYTGLWLTYDRRAANLRRFHFKELLEHYPRITKTDSGYVLYVSNINAQELLASIIPTWEAVEEWMDSLVANGKAQDTDIVTDVHEHLLSTLMHVSLYGACLFFLLYPWRVDQWMAHNLPDRDVAKLLWDKLCDIKDKVLT